MKVHQFCPAWLESHQIRLAGCLGLVEFVFGLVQLCAWSDFSQILDLESKNTNKTTCQLSGDSENFYINLGSLIKAPIQPRGILDVEPGLQRPGL